MIPYPIPTFPLYPPPLILSLTLLIPPIYALSYLGSSFAYKTNYKGTASYSPRSSPSFGGSIPYLPPPSWVFLYPLALILLLLPFFLPPLFSLRYFPWPPHLAAQAGTTPPLTLSIFPYESSLLPYAFSFPFLSHSPCIAPASSLQHKTEGLVDTFCRQATPTPRTESQF